MSAQQVVFQYLSAGSNTLTVPDGFSSQVLVYAWGAGGGAGYNAPAGGGGGFVQGIVTVSSGDTVVISVGGQGGVGPRDGSGIGGIGDTPAISFNGGTTGVAVPTDHNDDQNYGAGGGGGAATAVLVNGVPMIVAAGGGGGGGGTSYQTGSPGTAGGVTTLASTTPRGGTSPGGYSVGGGGGAGYPLGGAGGQTFGDDAGAATGGYGGQNYANASVTSSTLTAGSGITPGGSTNALYPRAKRGYAGYDGAVIVIFTKSFQAYVKDTDWKLITNAYVKIPSSSKILYRTIPPTTNTFTNSGAGTFVVPPGVTSVTLTMIGGGGSGNGNYTTPQGWPSPGGGSAAYFSGVSVSVTPGASIAYSVGGSGGNTSFGSLIAGAGGNAPDRSAPTACQGGDAGIATGAGGVNGTKGGNGICGGGNGNGADSPYGTGGGGRSSGNGGSASGYGAGGGGAGNNSGGGGGSPGFITLSYSSEPIAEIVATGGWTPITQAWIKDNNEWKSIQSGISLVPIPSTADVVTINLNIAANANNYVLSDFLSATSYYPGRSIVNLTVNAGVIVGSGTVGTPALIIDGLVSGDLLNLINNGNIAGAGGLGGAAGSYVVTSGGACFPVNTLVSTPQGQIAIQDIQIGDIVYSYKVTEELNYAVELVEKTVMATAKHSWEDYNQTSPLLVITHEHGQLIVTKNHELLNNAVQNPLSDLGFARADELSIGDSLVLIDGVLTKILDIQPGEQYDFVYNLEVDDFHTYIAGGIRVHNGTQNSAKQNNSKGYQNFGYSTKGYASSTSGTTTSVPGRPGEIGGAALYVTYLTNLVNNGTIAGGGGGGGGGGGPTGGGGGGGSGRKAGSGANNGTLTAGGAGAGLGGAGGARGTAGSAGTNDTNAGGLGGAPGAAIIGIDNVAITTAGTIIGERKVIAREVG